MGLTGVAWAPTAGVWGVRVTEGSSMALGTAGTVGSMLSDDWLGKRGYRSKRLCVCVRWSPR